MKLFFIFAISLISSTNGQNEPRLDLREVANLLRISDTDLSIQNVTEREIGAGNMPIKEAWMITSSADPSFMPVVIYTSRKGILNSDKYVGLKKFLNEAQPKGKDAGYGLGSFDVPGIDESFVFFDEKQISPNNTSGVKGANESLKPINETGISIIGTVNNEDLDFQIFIQFQDKEKLDSFPEYKSMLHGPDFPDYMKLGAALVTVVRDSEILKREKPREDKRQWKGKEASDGDKPFADSGDRTTSTGTGAWLRDVGKTGWLWVVGLVLLTVAAMIVWRKKQ